MTLVAIDKSERMFEFEPRGNTIVVAPIMNLRESDFERIEEAAGHVFEILDHGPYKNIVLDFCRTDFYGSTALAFFVKLWKWVKHHKGRLAFCNLSDHEKEILQ